MAEGAMAGVLSNIALFFTQATTWLGDILDIITENPLLLIMCIAMPVCGFAVGLLGRLFRL